MDAEVDEVEREVPEVEVAEVDEVEVPEVDEVEVGGTLLVMAGVSWFMV